MYFIISIMTMCISPINNAITIITIPIITIIIIPIKSIKLSS